LPNHRDVGVGLFARLFGVFIGGSFIREFEAALPGWWWSICVCSVSRDASCGPDVAGPDADLLEDRTFDRGFHCDDRNGTLASSLRDVMAQALDARTRFCAGLPHSREVLAETARLVGTEALEKHLEEALATIRAERNGADAQRRARESTTSHGNLDGHHADIQSVAEDDISDLDCRQAATSIAAGDE
jgi:hypothetical protein